MNYKGKRILVSLCITMEGDCMSIDKDTKITYINIAKALGIILVVIGHSISPVNRLIYLFHMPLFFFISGYLYRDSYSLEPIELGIKRLKSLYFPYIKYQLFFLVLHNIFFELNIYNKEINKIKPYSMKELLIHIHNILTFHGSELMGAALWFLPALFMVNVLFCLYNYGIKRLGIESENKTQIILATMVFLSFVLGLLRTKAGIPQFLNNNIALVAVSIFYGGYLFKRYESKIPFKIIYACIAFIVLIILWRYFKATVAMNKNNYSNPALFTIGWIFGVYVIMYISKLLDKRKNLLLNYIGSNTMIIMSFHFLAFKLVTAFQIYYSSLPLTKLASYPVLFSNNGWWMVYTVFGIFIPLTGKYLYDRIVELCKYKFTDFTQNIT